jgi:putative transposase
MEQTQHYRKSLRLKDYNYSLAGAYFITICTRDRKSYFEKFPNLQIIIHTQWDGLVNRFPQIQLDEFVVMPNHIHGIIFIVGAIHESPLQNRSNMSLPMVYESPLQNRRNMLLPKAIGYFKMNTAKQINQILKRAGQPFWQRNYYEHVIRNEKELKRIRAYIQNNPLRWKLDRENPKSKNFNLDHDSYWRKVYSSRGNS